MAVRKITAVKRAKSEAMRRPDIEVSKAVRKITAVKHAESAVPQVSTIYRKKSKRRKLVSRVLKPYEEQIRRIAETYQTFANDYLARHARSNSRRRDGWIYDQHENLYRAARKAQRQYLEDEEDDS
jgi:Family of unknown function (DUF6312)